MNIDLTGEETALLIAALTTCISKLKLDAALHREEGMPHWGDECDRESDRCVALKERLFK